MLLFTLVLSACPAPGAVLTDFTSEPGSSSAPMPGSSEDGTVTESGASSGTASSGTGIATSTGPGDTGSSTGGASTGTDGSSTVGVESTGTDGSGTDGSSSGPDGSSTVGVESTGSSTGEMCGCPGGCGDLDDDGYADGCDNCPEDANASPPQELPWNNQVMAVSDYDQDGLGNACDSCPHSPKTGAVPGENCCDPRSDKCTKTYAGSTILWSCHPKADGAKFTCENTTCTADYQMACFGCDGPCMPAGSLAKNPNCGLGSCNCDSFACLTRWCTVGDDASCKEGNVCVAWYGPGEAPVGLGELGVCAKAGACAGKTGRECATWNKK